MEETRGRTYRGVAEAAWRWVLDQVRWDDGPWIPAAVTDPPTTQPAWDRDGMHSGIGGLAYLLAELRCGRPWTAEEQALADAICDRIRRVIPAQTDCTFFDGLISSLGVLIALGDHHGAELAVARLAATAEPDGWPQTVLTPPSNLPGARINDLTIGTAGVVLGGLWARRHGTPGATELVEHAAGVLLGELEPRPTGATWQMVPARFRGESRHPEMPNLSHGVAGVALTLTLAAFELDRPDLHAAALRGAEYLVSVGDVSEESFVVPRYLPRDYNEQGEVTFTWCHGATGTSLLFAALDRAGVPRIAGQAPLAWHRKCLHSVRSSGLPARLHPGFWDNDGRCCGTAGVADVFLDSWQRAGNDQDLDFSVRLADTLVERTIRDAGHAYWRFIAHDAAEPLLPPGVGWMQGTAGIAAFLFRISRVLGGGQQSALVARMDNWWALPDVVTGNGPTSAR